MRVIIDSNGLQARAHAQDGKRLETFCALLRAIPACDVVFSPEGPLSADLLREQEVLVIATRKSTEAPYSDAEIDCIVDFVRGGGGLFLLSNHGDIPGHDYPDMTQNDAILARQFDIEIENTFFADPEPKTLSELAATDLLATHPILRGAGGEAPVQSIVANNCCSLAAPDGVPLVQLPQRMRDRRNGFSPQGRCFAVVAEDSIKVGRGRVVVVADSGFIGTEGTTFPGVGLIERGDNSRFVQNIVRWLAHASG